MGDRRFQSVIPRPESIDHRTVFLQVVIQFFQIGTKFLHIAVSLHLIRYGITLFENRGSCHFDKSLVNSILQRTGYRICDLGSNSVALLILVINQ